MSSPPQLYREGIAAPGLKAGEVSIRAKAASSFHKQHAGAEDQHQSNKLFGT